MVLNQKGCHYTPHVFGIMVGQPLQVVNSDRQKYVLEFEVKCPEEQKKAKKKEGSGEPSPE